MEEVFNSFSGAYEFNPATLMQRRPSAEREHPILDGQPSLFHERAHWFQFSGSTFGAVILTLHRAEELAILAGFKHALRDSGSESYIRECLTTDRPLLRFGDESAQVVPSKVAEFTRLAMDARAARLIFTESQSRTLPSNRPPGEIITQALVTLDETYRVHTGSHRPWPRGLASDIYQAGKLTTHAVEVLSSELTTRHILEGSAFLNQWTAMAMPAWGRLPWLGQPFTSLPVEYAHILNDAIDGLPTEYGLCFEFAFQRWSSLFSFASDDSSARAFACSLPTLACCFDIALNPSVVPLCRPAPNSWSDIYPPARFVAAVEAVRHLGLFERFPNNASYSGFREQVCRTARISIGSTEGRSFQHPGFHAEFFRNAASDDELTEKMSYFDFLIWAMESMHNLRMRRPLQWAIPWLLGVRFDGLDPVATAASDDWLFITTPMIWNGDNLSWGPLSEALVLRIAIDKCMLHCLKQAVVTSGTIDLTTSFPAQLLGLEDFPTVIIDGLVHTTGFQEFTARNISFAHHEPVICHADRTYPAPQAPGTRWNPFRVRRDEVENLDFSRMEVFFEGLCSEPNENMRSVDLRFDSYHADTRELYDIPEVTTYMQEFDQKFPYWTWYLKAQSNLDECAGLTLTFLSGLENPRRIPKAYLLDWLIRVTGHPLLEEGTRAGASHELLVHLTNDVGEALKSIYVTRF